MKEPNSLLEHYLCEQLAMEEQLCTMIEQQISDVDDTHFPDAKGLLIKTKQVLEQHYRPLNQLLDRLDQARADLNEKKTSGALSLVSLDGLRRDQASDRVSRILRDDYSALNLVAMGSTMLHTTALALDCSDVAKVALEHLRHLIPLVVKLREMMPHIVAREAIDHSGTIDPSVIGRAAVKNAQLAWRTAE